MTITTREQAFNVDNVIKFNGWDVEGGEVTLSDSEYEDILDEIFGDIKVCGQTFGSGSILAGQDPVAFRCGKVDYESAIQDELEEQLEREDDSGIEFDVHPDEVEEDEE